MKLFFLFKKTKTRRFRFSSVILEQKPVWLGFFPVLVRFNFFGFRLIKSKPNRTGWFLKILIGFFSWFGFSIIFFNFFSLIDFFIFSLTLLYDHYIGLYFCLFYTLCCLHSFSWQAFFYYYLYAVVFSCFGWSKTRLKMRFNLYF